MFVLKRNAVDRFRKRRQDRIEQRQDREFNEADVNRVPEGTSEGGQFAPKDGSASSQGAQSASPAEHFGVRTPRDFADSLKKPSPLLTHKSLGEYLPATRIILAQSIKTQNST